MTSPAVEAKLGFQFVAFLTSPSGLVWSLIPDKTGEPISVDVPGALVPDRFRGSKMRVW
jgi:hypothetical protein